MSGRKRRILTWGGVLLGAVAGTVCAAVCLADLYISTTSAPHLYEDPQTLPARRVGLVLGTSRNRGAGLNEFYSARIDAAAALYHGGRVEHLIVSGSNPSRYYNEPAAMKRDLVARDVPPTSITEDYAGLRTLDSVVRAARVMGQTSYVVVSQRFHAARAVYLARAFGLDVVGFCAGDPPGGSSLSGRLREFGARLKAVLDVRVLGTEPSYIGLPTPIELASPGTSPRAGGIGGD